MCVHMHMHVHVYKCVWMCVCMHVHACTYLSVCVYICWLWSSLNAKQRSFCFRRQVTDSQWGRQGRAGIESDFDWKKIKGQVGVEEAVRYRDQLGGSYKRCGAKTPGSEGRGHEFKLCPTVMFISPGCFQKNRFPSLASVYSSVK